MVNCIVIDDNQDIIDVFYDLLNISGIQVIATGNDGMQAAVLYEKYRPDVIFIDLIMPKYDGFYAIKKIRAIDPDSKIIIITGDLTMDESYLLDSYKITAVIYKPFDMNMVKQAIADAFLG
ncbi:response regulator [Nitrosarchaeum sp. AC2]|uniref:response regulator n=1 Tax=Nitrosarchaeum sp. AC2 TaxID=2259673 RepID=UPI0015CA74F6|nr:response regulator [Nitrosarchaeum sp. AC2]QLH10840.1 response regulator [Nitrosarchaeum sp. AC2]